MVSITSQHRLPALLIALLVAMVLAGCATAPAPAPAPDRSSTEGSVTEASTPTATPGPNDSQSTPTPAPRPSSDGATLALLNQSERAAENGALNEALSYAERAVRIEPRRADLWTHLATLELQNEHPGTAIRYAKKALSLATDRPDWTRDAWLVIAEAKEAMGQNAEAAEIRERWLTVRG